MKNLVQAVLNQDGSEISKAQIDSFRSNFKGTIIIQGDENYDTTRMVWNKMIDKRPAIIARCAGVADVIAAVYFAKENNLMVSIRGGGHNVAGNAVGDNALMIDLSNMKTVTVDPVNKTVNVEGGATWFDVDHETQAFGLACAGGVVSETGVAGLTLSGGLSWMRRKVGMSIDNLLEVDIVLANGQFLHASETENEDLFWALRGGGGNFGIVTNFKFKLQELGPEVFFTACIYPREDAAKVMEYWTEFTRTAPNEITTDCILWAIPDHPNFPPELHLKEVIVISGMYFGSPDEGRKMMQPLREIAAPVIDMSNVYPYTAIQQMFDPFLQKQTLYGYWKCLYFDDLTKEIQKRIIEKSKDIPAPATIFSLRNLQGALSEVPAQSTAFGDRSARFLFSIDTMWTEPGDNDKNIAWTREIFNEMHTLSKGKVYFNFNTDLEGPSDILQDSFGENYQKLKAVKRKYDPDNFFRLNTNIKA